MRNYIEFTDRNTQEIAEYWFSEEENAFLFAPVLSSSEKTYRVVDTKKLDSKRFFWELNDSFIVLEKANELPDTLIICDYFFLSKSAQAAIHYYVMRFDLGFRIVSRPIVVDSAFHLFAIECAKDVSIGRIRTIEAYRILREFYPDEETMIDDFQRTQSNLISYPNTSVKYDINDTK